MIQSSLVNRLTGDARSRKEMPSSGNQVLAQNHSVALLGREADWQLRMLQ